MLYILTEKGLADATTETTKAVTCQEIEVMKSRLLSAENIQTSSNSLSKNDLLSRDSYWSSDETDPTPTVIITLSDFDITITELMLVNPTNVNSFNVTITALNGETVYTSVSSNECINLSIILVYIIDYVV